MKFFAAAILSLYITEANSENWIIGNSDDSFSLTVLANKTAGICPGLAEIALSISCSGNESSLFVLQGCILDKPAPRDIRITSDTGFDRIEVFATDNGAFLEITSDPMPIVDAIKGARMIEITYPHEDKLTVAKFDVSGLTEKISETRNSCNW